MASISNTLPVAVDLVTNGGFERATDGNASNFYQDGNVDGWNAVDSETGQRLNIFTFAANGHQNVLELDSTAGQFDRIYQDINTRRGDSYILSFELRERNVASNANVDTNKVEVFWGGQNLGTFSATNHWQSVNVAVDGLGDTSRLTFREVSLAASDSRGPLIDNVRLVKIAEDAGVTNGDFEDNQLGENASPNVQQRFVDGWFAMGADRADRILALRGEGGSEGDQFLQLDTGGGRLDRVYSDVATNRGEQYYVSFDLRGTEQLRVRWNNEWVGTFQAESEWQNFGVLVDAAAADETRLIFRELTADPSGDGPQIDNIQVSQVGEFEAFAGVRALSELDGDTRNSIYTEAPELTIDPTQVYRANIEIESGAEIDLLLYADQTPNTVNNFVNLALDGWYDGLSFNRVVQDFVAQTGGPFETNTGGGPGYTFADEIVDGLNFNTQTGLLAMANAGAGTNGSQFFITYGNPTHLNGAHTIFGEIEAGDTDSFDTFNNLTIREGTSPTPGDVIRKVTITVEDA